MTPASSGAPATGTEPPITDCGCDRDLPLDRGGPHIPLCPAALRHQLGANVLVPGVVVARNGLPRVEVLPTDTEDCIPAGRLAELETALASLREIGQALLTMCRECHGDGAEIHPAVVIIWGKLSPPEALGPRCYEHAAKHLGHAAMGQLDQWAVVDLRPLRAALAGGA